MLCPEVWDFPKPKVLTSTETFETSRQVENFLSHSEFYKSVVITCPDELQTPKFIEEIAVEDIDYYKISNFKVHEFLDPSFVDYFIKSGEVSCLSIGHNCVAHNCASITSNGELTLHITDYIFQTLGLQGTKYSHNFYEIILDLKNLKQTDKTRIGLEKLEALDFFISWIPIDDRVCPSSIAKYFVDRGVKVEVCSPQINNITQHLSNIPSINDVELDEIVDWIGMLAIKGDLEPEESFISTYALPESENSIKSTRSSLLVVKGFLVSKTIGKLCKAMTDYVSSRQLSQYWASVSVQDFEYSQWQWKSNCQKKFEAHNCSRTIFFLKTGYKQYSIAEIKYP